MILIEVNGNHKASNGIYLSAGNCLVRGLAINRFLGAGVTLEDHNSNTVQGNFIGTDPTGTVAEPNTSDGILIANGFPPGTGNFDLIGGNTPAARNVISGNGRNGMTFDQTAGSMVYGNYIGTNAAGTAALGNAGAGIGIFVGGGGHVIGGPGSYGNVISGNGSDGIGFQSSGNTIEGNLIGTNAAGTAAVPNGHDGIFMSGETSFGVIALTQNNVIGAPGAGNLISGNSANAVEILNQGISPAGNSIQSNSIGVDVTGNAGIPNGAGVVINGATNTAVGSASAGAGNVISGNNGSAIIITGTGTTVQGNLIGTNAAGNSAIPNQGGPFGAAILTIGPASNTLIGGSATGARNIVSGNLGDGVSVWGDGGVSGVTVQGNYIGVKADGTSPLGNSSSTPAFGSGVAVRNYASNIVIGGLSGQGNIIANNGGWGVVPFSGTAIEILGNTILQNDSSGILTGATGTIAGNTILSNHQHGIHSVAADTVGGTTAAYRNVISGNGGDGVHIAGSGSSGSVVYGNYIGTDASGAAPLANGGNGVTITASNNNAIGGLLSGQGNTIAFNQGSGVSISLAGAPPAPVGNSILSNVIYGNGQLGIDRGADGVTANRIPAHPVPQAYPSNPDTLFAGQNYSSPVRRRSRIDGHSRFGRQLAEHRADSTGVLEPFRRFIRVRTGQTLIGTTALTTDNLGNAVFSLTPSAPLKPGQYISATSTDPGNNTSNSPPT